MKFGDEVRERDVNEPAAGDWQEPDRELFREATKQDCETCTRKGGKCGEEVEPERLRARVPGMDEDAEVTNLLRNLVENDGDGRGDTNLDGDHVACGDDDAVDEVMHSVRDEDHAAEGVGELFCVLRRVMVVPVQRLLEDEEGDDAADDRERDHGWVADFFERLRNDVYEHVPEERTHRERDENEEALVKQVPIQYERNCSDEGYEANQSDACEYGKCNHT